MGFQGVPITVDLSQRTTSTQKELSSCAQLLQSWPSLSLKYFSVYMKSRPIASCCRTALTLTMVGQHSKTSWAKTMSSKMKSTTKSTKSSAADHARASKRGATQFSLQGFLESRLSFKKQVSAELKIILHWHLILKNNLILI